MMEKKNIEQTNLKKKNPTWVFLGMAKTDKNRMKWKYTADIKKNNWILFYCLLFFIKLFVEFKEK